MIQPPVILLCYANDKVNDRFLKKLPQEADQSQRALLEAEKKGYCHVVVIESASLDRIFLAFEKFRDRIAVFHFSGHSNELDMLLQKDGNENKQVSWKSFGEFLGMQNGLRLIVFNSCVSYASLENYYQENIPSLIYTTEKIIDNVALIFAKWFYIYLGNGDSILNSFEKASISLKEEHRRALQLGYTSQPISESFGIWKNENFADSLEWDLPTASKRRLGELPPVAGDIGFPTFPYKYLAPYERSDANIYWGRELELLRLFSLIDDSSNLQVILLSGSGGSGKTSLLQAGLIPRLERDYVINNLTLFQEVTSLEETLHYKIGLKDSEEMLQKMQLEKRHVWVIDNCDNGLQGENEERLLDWIRTLEKRIGEFRQGEIVLIFSVRDDFLSTIAPALNRAGLDYAKVALDPSSKDDIERFVNGITEKEELRNRYQVMVEEGLAELIYRDLEKDPFTLRTLSLQLIMTNLYKQLSNQTGKEKRLTIESYQKLDQKGILVQYLKSEIEAIENSLGLGNTGFVLNILKEFVGPLGSPLLVDETNIAPRFSAESDSVQIILSRLKSEARILISFNYQGQLMLRLAHEFMAPLINELHSQSSSPAQLAYRVLSGMKENDELLGIDSLQKLKKGGRFNHELNKEQKLKIQASKKTHADLEKLTKKQKDNQKLKMVLVGILAFILMAAELDFINIYGLFFIVIAIFLYR